MCGIYKYHKIIFTNFVNNVTIVSSREEVVIVGIREKLKTSQVRLVELASYLNISRPTLYRYLELYEQKEYNGIDKRCYDLFSFIDKSRNLTRPVMMDYLINKILPIEGQSESDVEIIATIRKLTLSQSILDVKKVHLIRVLCLTDKLDNAIDSLLDNARDAENKSERH